MDFIGFKTDIEGKVQNTKLPKSKGLWALYETISNAIHAIEDKNEKKGNIEIEFIRFGDEKALEEVPNVSIYPIKDIIIKDNGVGFTNDNYESFLTSDSRYKIAKGAKGIGRFVCLKAFESYKIDSTYKENNSLKRRRFVFKAQKPGIFENDNDSPPYEETGTKISLINFRQEYREYQSTIRGLDKLAVSIIEHFLIYYLLGKCPRIVISDRFGDSIDLDKFYASKVSPTIKSTQINIGKEEFKLQLLRLQNNTHADQVITFCANDREVISEKISKYIPDIGKHIENKDGSPIIYQVYVTGSFLNKNVNSERTDFTFPDGDEEEVVHGITKKAIIKEIANEIEKDLEEYFKEIRTEKRRKIYDYVRAEAPEYGMLLRNKPSIINNISPDYEGTKLKMELYKLQQEWEREIKEKGKSFQKPKKDIKDLNEYKAKYDEYIKEVNDIGKSSLAKYIVHRKAVLDLFDNYLDEHDGTFMSEDAIHNIVFPLKKESDEINYKNQNLWLIDEKLAYHTYLASDISFKKMSNLNSNSKDRTDILIFQGSFAFVENESPHNSFTIIEFKKPQRTGYKEDYKKGNPVDQVITYIEKIRDSKAIDRNGRNITVLNKEQTKFYAYIICDISPDLKSILEKKDFKITPDGAGYYLYHAKYNTFIEIISYTKLLEDARKRNRILFNELLLPE